MHEIKKWAKGKNKFLSVVSIRTAYIAESLYHSIQSGIFGETRNSIKTIPDLEEWINLYKDHRRLKFFLVNDPTAMGFQSSMDFFSFFDNLPLRRISYSEKNDRRQIEIGHPDGKEVEIDGDQLNLILDGLMDEMKNQIEINSSESTFEEQTSTTEENSAEFLFAVQVLLPCWLLYNVLPGQLLRKARSGDIDSLDWILRLDSSAIFDPVISKQFHEASFSKNKFKYETMIKALNAKPRVKLTPQRVKFHLAGMISGLTHFFGQPFTEPQIRALFDAIARDTGKGEIDTDLPDSSEALVKAIQRNREFWF